MTRKRLPETRMTTTVVNVRHSEFDVYIGRLLPRFKLSGSKLGCKWVNPFRIGKDGTREEVIAKYEQYIRVRPDLMSAVIEKAKENYSQNFR